MAGSTGAAPAPERDSRVDFYRGLALVMIFVNHVPGTLWEQFTSRNFGFSDAAEVFVFLAGFASAFAYGRPFLAGSALDSSLRALARAGQLYLVHVTMTVATIALFVFAALASGQGGLLRGIGLAPLLTQPLDAILGVATLGFQLGYVNILPMYSAILLMLPAMLLIVRRLGLRALLAASAALWIACGTWRFNMPNHPDPGGWFFNPFAWQLLFAIGLAAGFAGGRGVALVPFRAPLYGFAVAYLVLAYLFVGFELWGLQARLPFPFLVQEFDKTFVTLPRLLHVLALIYVVAHAPAASPLSRIRPGNPLARLGRHSLPVFAAGTMLAMACQAIRFGRAPDALLDTALIGGGLALQFALAALLDWRRDAAARPRRPAAAARGEQGTMIAPLRTKRAGVLSVPPLD